MSAHIDLDRLTAGLAEAAGRAAQRAQRLIDAATDQPPQVPVVAADAPQTGWDASSVGTGGGESGPPGLLPARSSSPASGGRGEGKTGAI